jgi:hypothetical protein
MKRFFMWLVLVGAVICFVGVLWQAFSIAAYVRSGDDGWLDAHGAGSMPVHLGQLMIVIGAIVAAWGNWRAVGAAVGFLALSIVQLAALGNTDEEGSWVNGFHGFLALIVLLSALAYAQWAARNLGIRQAASGAAGSA